MRAPPQKHIVFYSADREQSKKRIQYFLECLLYYNATNNCTNPFFPYHKEKKKDPFCFRNEILPPAPLSNWLMYLVDPSGLTGLEPAASALTGRCSDQLNYNPREIRDLAEIWILFFLSPYRVFLKDKGVICGRLANYWAELDLNQRRHIANEFTVRPH